MKKKIDTLLLFSIFIASLSFVIATITRHTTCVFLYHQPCVPKSLK